MSFSFSETLATDLDYCRFRLDDVSEDDVVCSNELILATLNLYGVEGALVNLCNRIKLFYAKEPDRIGLSNGRQFSFKDRYEAYADLYEELLGEYRMTSSAGSDGSFRSGVLSFPPEVVQDYLPYQGIESNCGPLDTPGGIYPLGWRGAIGSGRY